MAQAITVTVDSSFDPSLPLSLHSVGVPNYTGRYIADTLPEGAGAVVTTWTDRVGTRNLAATDASRRPVVGVQSGHKFLSFDGTAQGLTVNVPAGSVKTVALVVRSNAAASAQGYILFGGDVIVSKHVNENAGMFLSGGAPQINTPTNSFPAGRWGIILAVVDGANSVIRANGAASVNATANATGTINRLAIGRDAGAYGKIDIAEMITWSTALSAEDADEALRNLQKRYAAILP